MTPRLTRRLWRHHLPLAVVTGASSFALYATRSYPDVLTRLSFATAWPALVLLAATLVIGPWRALRMKPYALSQDLRRDIGIWAGITGVLHAGVGQCVHLRGRPWLYYIYEKWQVMPVRYDVFGLSNHTGLIAALTLLLLLGGVIGAQFGAKMGTKLRGEETRALLGALVLAVALCLLWGLVKKPEALFAIGPAL